MNQALSPDTNQFLPDWKLSQPFEQNYFIENLFSLAVIQKRTRTRITMDVLYNQINTREIPFITNLLQENLPSVLATTCYNDQGLSFYDEVQQTEIGHLFEHIILEYLCQYKMAKGARSATYAGRTTWNWIRDPFGRFYIQLSCGKKDADILPMALEQTVALMKLILGYDAKPLFSTSARSTAHNGLKNGERRW
jgi:Cyanophycin synthase-like N-terminal domain